MASQLPQWRGFNLLEKFNADHASAFKESDFDLIAEWGFDFVRLPLSYRCWAKPDDWLNLNENALKDIDQAVELGRQRRIHVNINFHRAPGYCVNPPKEPLDLWTDDTALDACAHHWRHFARRYKGIPNAQVSFDLLNEPPDVTPEQYTRVATRLVNAIREEDPQRLVIADGAAWGTKPVPALAPLGVAQSTRGYNPMRLTHYKASWVAGSSNWPVPTWPLRVSETEVWDADRLREHYIRPWKAMEEQDGVGVHVGEWGVHQFTPHDVTLAFMRDCLALWKQAGWGWALWNLRGSFGVVDSGRADVDYESFRGHKLDRKMLEVLLAGK
jgi:endoglucanase